VIETHDDHFLQHAEGDRRTKRRFQIEQDVRYKMLYGQRIAETGTGKSINISSGGVWITTENMLTTGMPVELSLNWPVLLNDACPMKLMIYGCVVRSNERGAAVTIERYEFRTQGRTFQQPVAQQSASLPTEYRAMR
jgi:c-di-GMP-binding flagellar brake protein YcgR